MVLINLLVARYNKSTLDKKRGVCYLRIDDYVAERVKELCEKRGVSKYRLAQLTGMSQTAIGSIISKASMPTLPTLEKICDAFGMTLAQFFTADGTRVNLTEMQSELIETWENLDQDEQMILMKFVRSLKKN